MRLGNTRRNDFPLFLFSFARVVRDHGDNTAAPNYRYFHVTDIQ